MEDNHLAATGIVFNVQHFTIHDGPGIRTELFLKGCPLRCRWCSNPEGLVPYIQPGVYKKKCISEKKCGICKKVCPVENALQFYRGKLVSIDRDICTNCMACGDACPSEAVKQWGREMTVEEAMKEIRRDKGYYERSGGGVTLCGGEPLLQPDFIVDLFKACREEEINTCCESALHIKWENIEKILPWTDIMIADIKHMDSEIHKANTGVGNELIHENLKKLAEAGMPLILRIPVIPGFNDNMENMEKTADFILNEMGNQIRTLQLLSFMRLGEEKYESLGMPYQMKEVRLVRKQFQKKIAGFADYFKSRGIHCLVGTREKE